MTHEVLDGHDVTAFFEESGCIGMAEFVQRGVLNPGTRCNLFETPKQMVQSVAFWIRKDSLRRAWRFLQE